MTIDRSHLLGAFAAGAACGALALGLAGRAPVSREEARSLAIRPVESLAFPGHWSFGPFPCSDRCEGHLAGFHWAQLRNAKHAEACEGHRSASFSEGCLVYLGVVGWTKDPTF